MLILFITICLFILLKVSIAKIKKKGAPYIIFDLNIYLRKKQNITESITNSKILGELLVIYYLTCILINFVKNF